MFTCPILHVISITMWQGFVVCSFSPGCLLFERRVFTRLIRAHWTSSTAKLLSVSLSLCYKSCQVLLDKWLVQNSTGTITKHRKETVLVSGKYKQCHVHNSESVVTKHM